MKNRRQQNALKNYVKFSEINYVLLEENNNKNFYELQLRNEIENREKASQDMK